MNETAAPAAQTSFCVTDRCPCWEEITEGSVHWDQTDRIERGGLPVGPQMGSATLRGWQQSCGRPWFVCESPLTDMCRMPAGCGVGGVDDTLPGCLFLRSEMWSPGPE